MFDIIENIFGWKFLKRGIYNVLIRSGSSTVGGS